MLNEVASSADDRPTLRSSVRALPGEDNVLHNQIRRMVMSVLSIEREATSDDTSSELIREGLQMIGAEGRPALVFEGRLLQESEAAYAQLDEQFATIDYLPLFREANGKHLIYAVSGRVKPQDRPVWPNVLLLVATLFSVLMLGTEMAINEINASNPAFARELLANFFTELWRGLPYAISVMLILGAHELGHYFLARRHKIAVSLPYFIPAPFISPIGTFGAFIQMREPMRNRKVLLDVGAAGPLFGLLFAIPILLIGLATSQVGPISPGGLIEGNSLLYALAKTITFGRFLPDGTVDVFVNQLAWAGWTGLLVTGLNLIPIGQLDGGHILYALIGDRARKLYFPLLGMMVLLVFITDAWMLWLVLLFLFGRFYAAPLDMITRLDSRRRWIALLSIAVFIVTFVPVPFSMAADGVLDPILESASLGPLAISMVALYTFMRRR